MFAGRRKAGQENDLEEDFSSFKFSFGEQNHQAE